MNNDFIKTWSARPYSWSQHSSWQYDKNQWYDRYILGNKTPSSPALEFGKKFADAAEWGTPMAPILVYPITEHGITAKLDDLEMVGFLDGWHPEEKKLIEYKTGKAKWDQKRVDEHGQLTFYALLHYLANQIKPEDIHMTLQWLPTTTLPDFTFGLIGEIHTFETSRTMRDTLILAADIKSTRIEMERYAQTRLATIPT